MAIIRTKSFSADCPVALCDIDLYDTPEKLLQFVSSKGIVPVPLNLEKLAEEFNISVEYLNLPDDLSGELFKNPENDNWVIHVNKKHHVNRQRYTIAHEIAHFCLHRQFKYRFEDEIFFRGGESYDKEEMEANDFASSILIPEQELKTKIRSGVRKIEELAEIFEVSTLALRIRVKSLGMSGHGL
ncbi:MAG: ImmA/IrrE family metallo-endopeptidase [Candidatus Omnitrophota bacterium]